MKESNRYICRSMVLVILLSMFGGMAIASLPSYTEDRTNSFYFNEVYLSEIFSFGIVEAIQEDRYGFIWVGTKDGLFRYDGENFVAYYYDRSDTGSISNNVIRELYLDSDSVLWVGTENGLNRYIDTENRFERIFFAEGPGNPVGRNIREIAELYPGVLVIATIDGGLIRYNKSTGEHQRIHRFSDNIFLRSDRIRALHITQAKEVFTGSIDKGVEIISPDGTTSLLPSGPADGEHVRGTNIRCITEVSPGVFWIGTSKNGITIYQQKDQSFSYLEHERGNDQSLSSNSILFIYTDRKNRIWVGTDGGGLNLFDSDKQQFSRFRAQENVPGTISSDVVRVMYEDRAGNCWFGNFSGPLNYIDAHRKAFGLIRNNGLNQSVLISNEISALFVDTQKRLWIGNNGITKVNLTTGETQSIANLNLPVKEARGNVPLCFAQDSRDQIWIGLFEGGLVRLNPETGSMKHYYPDGSEKMPRGYQIWDLWVEEDSIWLANEMGLDVLILSEDRFVHVPENLKGKGINSTSVWKVMRDSKGRVLVGTNEGLNVLDPLSGEFSYLSPDPADSMSLSEKWVLTVFEDSKQRIWVGTNGGGLNLWQEESNSFLCFNTAHGFSGNVINAILEDESGDLWLTTNGGITRFNYDKGHIQTFDARDGLQDNRFNIHVAASDAEGIFYVGGTSGMNIFNPEAIRMNDYLPPVYITGFEIFNKPVAVNEKNSPFKQNFHIQDAIELNFSDRVFTIHFASLNFALPGKNKYRYILEGFENEWNEVGHQTEATYTNLSPGRYIFKVEGSNNDNQWSGKQAILEINIPPPYYRTWWFITLVLVFIATMVYLVYMNRVMRVKRLNHRLSELVSERTREIEQRNREIAEQNKEITRQRDIATSQRDQIKSQNEELEKHRNRLEELVEERTHELVEAKDKAEESDRLKTVFLENISYEIRTPMNAIVGFINLLGDRIDDRQSREYYMRIINESGKNMLRLVQDVIDFSRMQIGELQPEYEETNVSTIIRDLVSVTRERASREKPDLSIISDLPEEKIEMFTDNSKLTQIFSKLIENAMKYTESGHIKLGIKEIKDKQITFYVEDSGPGIELQHREKIFDRFFTLHRDQKHGTTGSGLGLAFAKLATEMLGGKIWVESENGDGSRFCFSIPFIRIMSEADTKKSASDSFRWPDKMILVAEDEESNFLLIEAILKDTGVKLVRACDGVELLEIVDREENFDLVLLDLKMPRMGGINAMQIIRETHKEVPVIVQTAYDQTNHRDLADKIGCNDFLVKPLRKIELLQTVKKYLG